MNCSKCMYRVFPKSHVLRAWAFKFALHNDRLVVDNSKFRAPTKYKFNVNGLNRVIIAIRFN